MPVPVQSIVRTENNLLSFGENSAYCGGYIHRFSKSIKAGYRAAPVPAFYQQEADENEISADLPDGGMACFME